MGLLQKLATDNRIQLEGRPKEDNRALSVVTCAQKKRAQSQEETQGDAIESQEETQEDSVKSREGTQGNIIMSLEEAHKVPAEYREVSLACRMTIGSWNLSQQRRVSMRKENSRSMASCLGNKGKQGLI